MLDATGGEERAKMVESWSTAEVITCPVCGRPHQWEMWVLVNPQDRPDLLVQLHDGSIRHMSCPHCGQDMWSGKPLMVFNPSGFPRALIMTTVDERHSFDLMSPLFRDAIKDEWRSDDVMVWLPQQIMPFVFKRDVRSDLMTFHRRPDVQRGESLYLDFLEDIREAQRAV
jgi:hemolysin-activating ACP:hemolysin acyltransferase